MIRNTIFNCVRRNNSEKRISPVVKACLSGKPVHSLARFDKFICYISNCPDLSFYSNKSIEQRPWCLQAGKLNKYRSTVLNYKINIRWAERIREFQNKYLAFSIIFIQETIQCFICNWKSIQCFFHICLFIYLSEVL